MISVIHRGWQALAVATIISLGFASDLGAVSLEAIPPDAFPECRRDPQGTWHFVQYRGAHITTDTVIMVTDGELWWSYHDQTTAMALIDELDTRRLYRLEPAFLEFSIEGSYPTFNYLLFETPIGKFGLQVGDKIWPCAATIIFCRNRDTAEQILRNDFTIAEFSTDGCIDANFVPYPLTWE